MYSINGSMFLLSFLATIVFSRVYIILELRYILLQCVIQGNADYPIYKGKNKRGTLSILDIIRLWRFGGHIFGTLKEKTRVL